MTYELAKQLKDAGFPQAVWQQLSEDSPIFKENLQIFAPTLSELIEACGDKFDKLYKDPYEWGAHYGSYIQLGKTPEEAVAKLWLDLQRGYDAL